MREITNISNVTDFSGEQPVTVYSNPVLTVINDPASPTVITRIFYNLCDCCCQCNCCCCNN